MFYPSQAVVNVPFCKKKKQDLFLQLFQVESCQPNAVAFPSIRTVTPKWKHLIRAGDIYNVFFFVSYFNVYFVCYTFCLAKVNRQAIVIANNC